MNSIQGHIEDIQVSGNLSLITVQMNEQVSIYAMVIDTPESTSYIKRGNQVNVLFKETEVVISTGKHDSNSILNQISGIIRSIEIGTLLSNVLLDTSVGEIRSIVATKSINQLEIQENTEVSALINVHEVMISI